MKVITLLGTRPDIIRLSRVMKKLDQYFEHIMVHTGQNYDYELNAIFFEQLEIRKPDYFLNVAGGNLAHTIGNVIINFDEVLEKEAPDAILILGDTNSALGIIPAKRRKIPIFHMEAGNRCFDLRVPEEINRKIVDHLSDINMPLSEHARRYLISEGIKPENIIKTGSSMKEVLKVNMKKILDSDILLKEGLEKGEYILMSIHREENVDSKENFEDLLDTIEEITKIYKKRIIISTHPRTKKKLQEIGYENNNSLVQFSKPFGFHEYNNLQINAFCVISDSGTIAEESSILNLPSITIRQAHERPEGMDEGVFIMSGLKKSNVIDAIKVVTEQNKLPRAINEVTDYTVENVSLKVLRIILSYTSYINRTVWHK